MHRIGVAVGQQARGNRVSGRSGGSRGWRRRARARRAPRRASLPVITASAFTIGIENARVLVERGGIAAALQAELEVAGGHRVAVAPAGVAAQVKRVREPVGADVPALGTRPGRSCRPAPRASGPRTDPAGCWPPGRFSRDADRGFPAPRRCPCAGSAPRRAPCRWRRRPAPQSRSGRARRTAVRSRGNRWPGTQNRSVRSRPRTRHSLMPCAAASSSDARAGARSPPA